MNSYAISPVRIGTAFIGVAISCCVYNAKLCIYNKLYKSLDENIRDMFTLGGDGIQAV